MALTEANVHRMLVIFLTCEWIVMIAYWLWTWRKSARMSRPGNSGATHRNVNIITFNAIVIVINTIIIWLRSIWRNYR